MSDDQDLATIKQELAELREQNLQLLQENEAHKAAAAAPKAAAAADDGPPEPVLTHYALLADGTRAEVFNSGLPTHVSVPTDDGAGERLVPVMAIAPAV